MENVLGKLKVEGDKETQDRLLRYLQGGGVHPGSVLVGPNTPKRWTLAKNIAKQLLCLHSNSSDIFCDQCSFCRRVEKEILPDVLFYREPQEEIIKIDTLRELCQQMLFTPMEAKAKVCLIDDCHRMNTASANAFLKTLEEPGTNRFFWLLTSQPARLPVTILSRCLIFRLSPSAELSLFSPEEELRFSQLLEEVLTSKSTTPLSLSLSSKEKVIQFVHFIQKELRNAVTGEAASPRLASKPKSMLCSQFNHSLELEWRLHSNANYSLMLDSFFRRNFVD